MRSYENLSDLGMQRKDKSINETIKEVDKPEKMPSFINEIFPEAVSFAHTSSFPSLSG